MKSGGGEKHQKYGEGGGGPAVNGSIKKMWIKKNGTIVDVQNG